MAVPTALPKPMLARIASTLPEGPNWSYEVKWDGYRALAVKDGAAVQLISRNGSNLTAQYRSIAAAIATLRARHLVLDGEIVALDADGRPSFQALQHRSQLKSHTLVYYAFDVLAHGARSLLAEPLTTRRRILREVVGDSAVWLSEALSGTAAHVEKAVRTLGLEGVIAKRMDSRYEPGQRSGAWIKVKFARRQEFVVGGFRPDGHAVDALVVGYYDRRRLMAAGKVRAGMTPSLRRELFATLAPLKAPRCPFTNLPDAKTGHWGEGITAADMATVIWVKPQVVAEIAFTEWTQDARLRHAAFVGLRHDVTAGDVRREP
jgi:DNA ligase D-like protein (predicted ligase)